MKTSYRSHVKYEAIGFINIRLVLINEASY